MYFGENPSSWPLCKHVRQRGFDDREESAKEMVSHCTSIDVAADDNSVRQMGRVVCAGNRERNKKGERVESYCGLGKRERERDVDMHRCAESLTQSCKLRRSQ